MKRTGRRGYSRNAESQARDIHAACRRSKEARRLAPTGKVYTHLSSPGIVYANRDERTLQLRGGVHHQPLQVERQIRQRRKLYGGSLRDGRRVKQMQKQSSQATIGRYCVP